MSAPPSPTLSDSELLDSLEEAGFDFASDRDRRIEALQREIKQVKNLKESDNGRVVTFVEEKLLIERMSKERYVLLHFFHNDFSRCKIMDQKLSELAPSYPHTLFLRACVTDIPFLVSKMAVQVLPCVMSFVDGKAVDRLIGFEELGDSDQFTSKMLEFRLKQSGVLPTDLSLASNLSSNFVPIRKDDDDISDDEDRRHTTRGARKGKVGIRNGLYNEGSDDDY
ncbi:uncharacterized protein I206_105815 [Kwoniella pini CBS 10737]|uniref:GTPase inhibitor n=1 Tax=Kwoniella pini CBS 10737 TaxID=1296096 RepID=A0A1B9I0F4_9TREE|nr:uncharacterized protein I206_04635 [Kwoniella pini CBS 10737]OCF48948.1 hypothetical protein I206_04635 [Kwoniella pini CBS 10737]